MQEPRHHAKWLICIEGWAKTNRFGHLGWEMVVSCVTNNLVRFWTQRIRPRCRWSKMDDSTKDKALLGELLESVFCNLQFWNHIKRCLLGDGINARGLERPKNSEIFSKWCHVSLWNGFLSEELDYNWFWVSLDLEFWLKKFSRISLYVSCV